MSDHVSANRDLIANPIRFFRDFVPEHLASYSVAMSLGKSVEDCRSDLLEWTRDARAQGYSWAYKNGILFFNADAIDCYVGFEKSNRQGKNKQMINRGV